MNRIKDIQDKLLHVVGWEQAYNPAEAIKADLLTSESGLTFQGAHPLLTLDNIKNIVPDNFLFIYPDWNIATPYVIGDKVKAQYQVFIAIAGNVGTDPLEPANGETWEAYNLLSDYLERETRKGIAAAVQTFIQTKQLDSETKTLLERRTFFDGAGRLAATINNRSKVCGYEIVPVRSMGVTTKIERIGLQMIGGIGTVRVYVFHSSKVEPIKTIDVAITDPKGGFKWVDVENLYLPYISDSSDSQNAGGSFYICYNQVDLPEGMEAINISKDWSRDPCMTCNMGDLEAWRQMTKYMQISPFTIPAPEGFQALPEMWDIQQNIFTNTQNYGINVEFSVGCDLTDFIIAQRHIFQNVIQKQVAATLLRTIALNPDVRVNRNQSNVSKMDMLYELDGNTAGERPAGLGYELKKAYEALKMDTTGIDRICLSCNNKGVRYRTA